MRFRSLKRSALTICICSTLVFLQTAEADVSGDPEKISGWVVAYKTDASGGIVRGNLNRLIRAVEAGADLKILWGGILRECNLAVSVTVVNGNNEVACFFENIRLYNTNDPLTLYASPYRSPQYVDTAHQYAVLRVGLYDLADQGKSVLNGPFEITWFAKVR